MLLLSLLLALPATARPTPGEPGEAGDAGDAIEAVRTPGNWVAVADDTRACIASQLPGGDAPCLRLTGSTRSGAWLGRLVADHGEQVVLSWERPPHRSCVDPVPHGLADLGLRVRVQADALLPLVTTSVTLPVGGGASLDLRPGQPLLSVAEGPGLLLGAARLALPAGPDLPSLRTATDLPGPPSPPTWPAGRAMQLAPEAGVAALEQVVAGLSVALPPHSPLSATWLDGHAVAVTDHCARLVVPWDPAAPPGRPVDHSFGGATSFDRDGVVPAGATLTLANGHPVGRTTRPLTLGEQRRPDSSVLPSARRGSQQGGRTCFTVPAAAPGAAVAPGETRLELCVASGMLQ